MSTIYPSIISIRRQMVPTQFGTATYSGDAPVQEAVLFTNVPASIQYERVGRTSAANLPTDTRRSTWLILIPRTALSKGSITENDIVEDDLGKRYQVYAADFQGLGYNLHTEMLNV